MKDCHPDTKLIGISNVRAAERLKTVNSLVADEDNVVRQRSAVLGRIRADSRQRENIVLRSRARICSSWSRSDQRDDCGGGSFNASDWFLLSLFSRERSEPLHKALSRFFLFTRRSRKWPASADWPLRRKDWPPKVTGIYFPPAQQHHFRRCSSAHHFLAPASITSRRSRPRLLPKAALRPGMILCQHWSSLCLRKRTISGEMHL